MAKNKMIRFTLALFLLLSIALIGCGGGGSDSSAPAAVTPTPTLTLLPADFDFGIVTNGNSVDTLEVTVKNDGTANLIVSDIALSGLEKENFVLNLNAGTNPCGTASSTVAPGSNCNVTVEFDPADFGTFGADLSIQSNDPTSPTYNMGLLGSKENISAISVKINQIEACPRNNATIYASVTDQGGYPVTGLNESNFTIAENGGMAAIPANAGFVNDTVTLSVALLMDYSFSITQEPDNVADMQNAAIDFVKQLGSNDEAEIVKYATTVEVTHSFDDSQTEQALTTAIQSTPVLGGGETSLYDAIAQAVSDFSGRTTSRRAIIIITDGKDDDGTGNPLSDATLDEVIADANAQGVPVFTVGLGSANVTILQQLASDTGGTYSDSPTSDNLSSVYQQLADLLFTDQYILTYSSGIAEGSTGNLTLTATYDVLTPAVDTKIDGISACP